MTWGICSLAQRLRCLYFGVQSKCRAEEKTIEVGDIGAE
jgi:hypothetical protein